MGGRNTNWSPLIRWPSWHTDTSMLPRTEQTTDVSIDGSPRFCFLTHVADGDAETVERAYTFFVKSAEETSPVHHIRNRTVLCGIPKKTEGNEKQEQEQHHQQRQQQQRHYINFHSLASSVFWIVQQMMQNVNWKAIVFRAVRNATYTRKRTIVRVWHFP